MRRNLDNKLVYFVIGYVFYAMASGSSNDTQTTIAQKTWEMANNVETISTVDEMYRYDRKQQQDILAAKPWEKE